MKRPAQNIPIKRVARILKVPVSRVRDMVKAINEAMRGA